MLTKRQIKKLCTNVRHRRWYDAYKRLILFKETFNRWPKQLEEYPKGMRVGQWLSMQKKVYSKDKMPTWRRRLLDEIDFPWAKPYDWWEKYRNYDNWYKRHQRIPRVHSPDTTEQSLYSWRIAQRRKYDRNLLSREQIAALAKIGVFDHFRDIRWNDRFDRLKNFIKKTGTLPVSHGKNEHEGILAAWRHHNRKLLKNSRLSKDKAIAFRNEITIASPLEMKWNRICKEAVAFFRDNARFPSRASKNKKEISLAQWRLVQMARLKNGTLPPKRASRFIKAGLDRNAFDMQWRKNLTELKKFIGKNNRLPRFSGKNQPERSLAIWISKNHKIADEKLAEELRAMLCKQESQH